MKKTFWLLVAAVLLVALISVAGCKSSGPAKKTAPKKTETAEPGTTPAKKSVSIEISNFTMNPDKVTVPKGSKVTWTNKDSVAHTATADNGEFDSGQINPGETWSHTFDTAGTFGYHCTIHPTIVGTVVVK